MQHNPHEELPQMAGQGPGQCVCQLNPLTRYQEGSMTRETLPRFQPRLEVLEDRCTPSTITDFLNAQGTTSVFNYGVTGYPDEIGWSTATSTFSNGTARFARVDYTGQDAAFLGLNLGTTTSGTVSEHPLKDGRVQVIVNLHTHNAMAFAQDANPPNNGYPFGPVLFGYTPDQLAANPGLTPPVGDSNLQLVYNAAPGAPPPDIVNAFILGGEPGYELVSISIHLTASGTTPSGQQASMVLSQAGPEGRTPTPFSVKDFGFASEIINIQTNNGKGPPAAAAPTASALAAAPLSSLAPHSHAATDAVFATFTDDPLA
jgi:hypothetical protein